MIWFGIAFLVLAAIILTFIFSKLNVIVEYRQGELKITFRNKLFKYVLDDERLKNFSSKKGEKTEENKKDNQTVEGFFSKAEKIKRQYNEFRDVIDDVLDSAGNRAEFTDIYVRVRFGTGDAAYTGMAYGGIWSLIGSLYAYLCRFIRLEFPEVELIPVYNEKTFEIEAEGIIKIPLVHIITAVFRGLKIYKRSKQNKKGES